jgi:hypothetical protein
MAGVIVVRQLHTAVQVEGGGQVCTKPVTRAVYQLFLDETRSGDAPSAPTGPAESGSVAITGAWGRDARAFVDWLNEHKYTDQPVRLPLLTELAHIPGTQGLRPAWATDQKAPATTTLWLPSGTPHRIDAATLRQHLAQDIKPLVWLLPVGDAQFTVLSSQLDQAQKLGRALDRARIRARDFDRALDRTVARRDFVLGHALDRALDRDRDLDFDRALDRARDLDFDRALDRDRDLDRALDRARDLAIALDHARDFARDLDRVYAFARARARDLTFALDHALALARELVRVLARELVRALDLEGVPRPSVDRIGVVLSRAVNASRNAAWGRGTDRNPEAEFILTFLQVVSEAPTPLDVRVDDAWKAVATARDTLTGPDETWFSTVADRLLETARPIFNREQSVTAHIATTIRLPALCLAVEAERTFSALELGARFREMALAITLLERYATGQQSPCETILLAHA